LQVATEEGVSSVKSKGKSLKRGRSRYKSHWTRYETPEGEEYYVDEDELQPTQWNRPQSFIGM